MTEEIWKQIDGYPNYEVSDQGRVRNIKTGNILKPAFIGSGKHYLGVSLCQNGQKKTCRLHRLVAEAFISNPMGLPQINHRNENTTDNRASNLEWCDAKYNANYGTRNERIALSQSKPVEQYDLDGNYIRTWISANEASKQTGIGQGNISNCCNGKPGFKTAGGFIWRFAENLEQY